MAQSYNPDASALYMPPGRTYMISVAHDPRPTTLSPIAQNQTSSPISYPNHTTPQKTSGIRSLLPSTPSQIQLSPPQPTRYIRPTVRLVNPVSDDDDQEATISPYSSTQPLPTSNTRSALVRYTFTSEQPLDLNLHIPQSPVKAVHLPDSQPQSPIQPLSNHSRQTTATTAPPLLPLNEIKLVDWHNPTDPLNPIDWPFIKKITITVFCVFVQFCIGLDITSLTVLTNIQINNYYGVSQDVNTYWPVTSWLTGFAIFILLSQLVLNGQSVRWSAIILLTLLIGLIIPQGFCSNYAGFIVLRFFAGGIVGLITLTLLGICSDVWLAAKRELAIVTFFCAFIAGIACGPVYGAAIVAFLQWKWILFLEAIWYGVLLMWFFLLIPETRDVNILKQTASRLRKETGRYVYTVEELNRTSRWAAFRIAMFQSCALLFTDWVILSLTIWTSIGLALIFIFTQSVPLVFTKTYDWTIVQTGLVQAALAAGVLVSWLVSLLWRIRASYQGQSSIYIRTMMVLAFLTTPGGLLMYALYSRARIHWILPAIGLGLCSFGVMTAIIILHDFMFTKYKEMGRYATTIILVVQALFAAYLPLVTSNLYQALQHKWASTLLAALIAFFGIIPLVAVLFLWSRISVKKPTTQQSNTWTGPARRSRMVSVSQNSQEIERKKAWMGSL